jgi:hypothetical protein
MKKLPVTSHRKGTLSYMWACPVPLIVCYAKAGLLITDTAANPAR